MYKTSLRAPVSMWMAMVLQALLRQQRNFLSHLPAQASAPRWRQPQLLPPWARRPQASLINGIAIDTIVPIDAFAVGTNIVVTAQDPASCVATLTGKSTAATGSSGAALTTTSVTTAAGSATAGTDTLPPTFKITLSFLAAADWTNGPAADDALFAASPKCLNTGLVGATLPVVVTNGATPPRYHPSV